MPASETDDPVEFLRTMMKDGSVPADLRMRAASQLAKLGSKPQSLAERKRIRLGEGKDDKYAPSVAPKLRVVNH